MKIVALLSWYDEDPAWLGRCVRSLAKVPVDHLIALDGAYAHYPDAKPHSDPLQALTIVDAADDAGIETVDIRTPPKVWATEIDKRNHLFQLAERETTDRDWYMVIDADEVVLSAPEALRQSLASAPFDVAAVTLDEPGHPHGTIRFDTFPMFFRAIPGIRVIGEHFRYATPDGRLLWGDAKRERLEPRHLTGVHVEHRTQLRHTDRRRAALAYYDTRDALGLEDLPENRSLLKDAA